MTTDEDRIRAGDAEVAAFAEKLDAWAQTLAPSEQALLNRLLTRAASADPEPEDTEGYIIIVGGLEQRGVIVIGSRPSSLLLNGLGFSPRAGEGGGGVARI